MYLARSPGGRPAAVKVINDHLQHDEQVMSRFRREVETLATVRSAFTAALIDSELDAPPFWLATEYVPGPTLHSAIVDGGRSRRSWGGPCWRPWPRGWPTSRGTGCGTAT